MSDRYTKAVLTVIAAMLTVIAFENINFTKNAHAQIASDDAIGSERNPSHVIIEGTQKEYGIPVHITQHENKVQFRTNDPLIPKSIQNNLDPIYSPDGPPY